MLLRKWRSNSKQLNLLWQKEGVKTESSETSAIDLRPPTKVLGLAWDPENDLIYFDPKDLLKFMSHRGESKRFILSVVGRIFDSIGILGPPWLKLTPDHWPNRHRDILDSELCSEELEHRSSVHVAVTQQREALVDINRFSSLKKLLKTTAWVFPIREQCETFTNRWTSTLLQMKYKMLNIFGLNVFNPNFIQLRY
ncbi:integrase catalytic domain-containing protein [Trichonephila clavipes]|nr:integrase catalytic domain-containing protein [Trichonephila clavipes]